MPAAMVVSMFSSVVMVGWHAPLEKVAGDWTIASKVEQR